MIFKKKKAMNEKEMDNQAEQDDKLAQQQSEEQENQVPSETDKLRAELDEVKDKYVRLVAEFENFRKRTAKERIEMVQTAGKDVIQALLPVLDDNERAMKTIETATDVAAVKEGMSLVMTKLSNILTHKGLKQMENTVGSEFNAELHEAITEIPAPTEDMQGKVIDVLEPGYYLNDKLIRYAKVVVGK
jgi:molecular chaperone GrpE